MKNKIKKYSQINKIQIILGLFILVFFTFSCEKEEYPTPEAATIITASVSSVTGSSAISGGQITSDAGHPISTRGICWDTIENPTIGKSFALDTLGLAEFSNELTGLKGGTKYYVRAFATNDGGIAYGANEMFTTNVVPYLTTDVPKDITGISATGGGVITESFGAQIVERGVCWSTELNPTIDDPKTTEGAGSGPFTSSITGLVPSTAYHVRSYATTSDGDTGYGNDVIFETQILDYDGNVYTKVQIGEQVWMVQNYICTHYNDGTAMEDSVDYLWHADDVNHEYGLNYKGTAMLNPKFAPAGWHVPTNEEWLTLIDYVGSDGTKLKEAGTDHWDTDNGTNETGFTALGSSFIYGVGLKALTTWWTSTKDTDSGNPFRYYILDDGSMGGGPWNDDSFLFSVRLIKD